MSGPLQTWRRHFLWAEFALSVLIGIAAAYWIHYRNGAVICDRFLGQNRATIYGTLATIFGSLLGFVITAASIVLGFSGSESLAVVRGSKHYPTLWRVFTASIRALAFATVVSVIALVIDRDGQPNRTILCLLVFAVVLAALRIWRCVWVIEQIIFLVSGRPNGGK
jgi:hypothetical protein